MAYDSAIVMTRDAEHQIRRLILALLTFGLVALGGELVALGHYEDSWQLVPLGLLATAVLVIAWHAFAGSAATILALRVMMVLIVAAGAVGIMLHYQGNVEFQLEVRPDLGGWELFTKVLHAKAPPALAPGVMAQLGLLGLIYTWRHPALRGSSD